MASARIGQRPRLRGVFHQYAFFVAAVACGALVVAAPTGRARVAVIVYAVGLCGLLGVSALYHRVTWSAAARRWMRRLDHSMIFVLVAATYTPFALLVFTRPFATVILLVAWSTALAGIVLSLVWIDAPKPVTAVVYVALGWVAVATMPQLVEHAGVAATMLIVAGGALYTLGAVVYARRRPDPRPTVFGYHEVFHLLVIGAAAAHFLAVAVYAVPHGT
jgi:hemolysin III